MPDLWGMDATYRDVPNGQYPGGDEMSLECLDGPEGCEGKVTMRWPGYGDREWPRCQKHGDARLAREEENIARNGPDGFTPPTGFDPLDAGERWEAA